MKLTEKRLRQIIREEIFTSETGNRLDYDPRKMMRFVNNDALLTFQFKDMMRRTGDRKQVLRILFNSEVIGDSVMEREYMNA